MGIDSDTLYGTMNLLMLQALKPGPLHGLAVSRRLDRCRAAPHVWQR